MLKILLARLQQYVNWELPDIQVGFSKGRGTGDQITKICWSMVKSREFQKKKNLLLLHWLAKAFDCVDHNKGKFIKRWEFHTNLPASWEICMHVKKPQLELDM